MKIILVRHGESEYNTKGTGEENYKLTEKEDSKLTLKGKKQVEYLANRLKNYKISAIYTSNRIRTKETAEIISKTIKVPIKENFEELNEYSGKHLKKKIKTLFNFRLKRLKRLLKRLSKEKEKDKTILIVAHGITNRIIIGYLLKLPISKKILRFTQDNACVNFISWNKNYKNWSAWCVNDVSHIPLHLRNSQELNFIKSRT